MVSHELSSNTTMPDKSPSPVQKEPQQQQYQHQQPRQPELSLPSHDNKSSPPQPSSSSSSSSSSLSTIPIPKTFTQRKRRILSALAVPDDEYADLSPKGSIDAGIRELIDELNGLDGYVTTSSCAGRVSVFLEGRRRVRKEGGQKDGGDDGGGDGDGDGDGGALMLPGHHQAAEDLGDGEGDGEGEGEGDAEEGGGSSSSSGIRGERNTVAGFGGKGGGGRWLFVSHDPVASHGKLDSEPNIVAALLGMEEPIFSGVEGSSAEEMAGEASRLIHFKFEPMILHVLTASPQHAQVILRCGLQAGFRESGAINLLPTSSSATASAASTTAATPIVAIRSMGLGLESLIGTETNGIKHCTVSGEYLKALITIANERFVENARRIERFRRLLLQAAVEKEVGAKRKDGGEWEDAELRRERKRAEGLRRAEEVRRLKAHLEKKGEQKDGGGSSSS